MTVITIDGPSGSGKGTLAFMLAEKLKFNLLDSGALYRLTALACAKHNIGFDDGYKIAGLAAGLNINFVPRKNDRGLAVLLDGVDVSRAIRTEVTAGRASQVAAFPEVREALLLKQRAFAQEKNLVADGRDMGTVVFPHADFKFFLTASIEQRAKRRHKQLMLNGESVSMSSILAEIRQRDESDRNRKVAPLKAADDAVIVDNSAKTIAQTFAQVLAVLRGNNKKSAD